MKKIAFAIWLVCKVNLPDAGARKLRGPLAIQEFNIYTLFSMATFSETEPIDDVLTDSEQPEPPKRQRGRPRKDGAPPSGTPSTPETIAGADIPNPPFARYAHDHKNPNQRTGKLWRWIDELPEWSKPLLEIYVYREWPVLIKPSKLDEDGNKIPPYEQEPGYIAKAFYPELPGTDQAFTDRWGAGDYFFILKFNPTGGKRRDLCRGWVKCSHDFRTFPPVDDRIDDVNNLDLADPGNGSYIKWLKSQGKLKDEEKETRENEEMSAQAEVLGKVIEQNTKLIERTLDAAEKRNEPAPAMPALTPGQETETMLGIFERLQALIGANKTGSDVPALMQSAIAMAQAISKANDPAPYMQRIQELELQVRRQEADQRAKELAEITEQLRELKAGGGTPLQTVPTKSLVEQIKDAREMLAELGMDDDGPTRNSKVPWWAEMFAPLAEKAVPMLLQVGTAYLMRGNQPQPAPAAPVTPLHQHPQQQPMQAQPQQLPGPQVVPPSPQAQQQPPADPQQQAILEILTAIAGPVVSAIANGEGGDDFADAFLSEHGQRGYRLITQFDAETITQTLYAFPLTAGSMQQFPRENVLKFVGEFKAYDPAEYEKKLEAREKS